MVRAAFAAQRIALRAGGGGAARRIVEELARTRLLALRAIEKDGKHPPPGKHIWIRPDLKSFFIDIFDMDDNGLIDENDAVEWINPFPPPLVVPGPEMA